jgi:hypothetical protein
VPVPVRRREMVSPEALKVRFTVVVTNAVGAKRTVTVCVAPAPTRVNELPDTMLKGAEVDTVPVRVWARVLVTVYVRVRTLPRFTLPKSTLPVGLTVKATCATAFATGEQLLALPLVSTAVTAT